MVLLRVVATTLLGADQSAPEFSPTPSYGFSGVAVEYFCARQKQMVSAQFRVLLEACPHTDPAGNQSDLVQKTPAVCPPRTGC